MANLDKVYLFRMTHIANVPHIVAHGLTHKNSIQANNSFTPIGDPSLINSRNGFILNNGNRLGDYIPFYFGTRMPMLYVIQNGFNSVPMLAPEEIVYCVSSAARIIETGLEFIFTDGHAVDSFSSQYTKDDIDRIDEILDMKAINAKYWNSETDLDLKRRKEAEFLVLGDIPSTAILGFIVYNESAKNKLQAMGDIDTSIHIKSNAYF